MFTLKNSLRLPIGTRNITTNTTFLLDKTVIFVYKLVMDIKKLKDFCQSKITTMEFAKQCQCSVPKIKYWLKKYNLQKRQTNYLNQKQIKLINDLYHSKKSVREIQDITQISVSSIIKYLDNPRTKIEAFSTPEYRAKSKSGLNHYVFDSVTKESAYALGLIITDGSVDQSGYRISYHSKDDELIQIMKHIFNLTGSSYTSKSGTSLRFNSKYMVNSIAQYGVYPNKTFTMKMPVLKDKYYPHFFRGVVDGDGYIGLPRKTNILVSIVSGSELFLEESRKYIADNLGIKVSCRKNKRGISILEMHGKNAREFCNFIYQDSEGMRLSRKFNNYKKHIAIQSLK